MDHTCTVFSKNTYGVFRCHLLVGHLVQIQPTRHAGMTCCLTYAEQGLRYRTPQMSYQVRAKVRTNKWFLK